MEKSVAIWIDQEESLRTHIASWPAATIVGLDTEFIRVETYAPQLALVQTNVQDVAALIDALALPAMTPLTARLADPNTVTVMHSASEDLEALALILPCGPTQLFDTQIAAAMTGLGYGLSYQKLVAQLIKVDIPKSETRSDWLKRPLSAEQLEYAAQDVTYLPALYTLLTEQLATLGRSSWLTEDCQRLLQRARQRDQDPEPQRGFSIAADWPLEAQARLRQLLLWRDAAARRYNRPKSWLLEDSRILDLAQQVPQTAEELEQRTHGQRALRISQREDLWQVINAPLTQADFVFAAIPPPFDKAQKQALRAMQQEVATVATELQLPEGLLCPRRPLEQLLRDGAWPATLNGWRAALLHDRLLKLLPK